MAQVLAPLVHQEYMFRDSLTKVNRREISGIKSMTKTSQPPYPLYCGSPQRQPFIAGIYLLMSLDTVILPGKKGMFGLFFLKVKLSSLNNSFLYAHLEDVLSISFYIY